MPAANIKYPHVTVELSDCEGNTFAIMSRCIKAARRAKVSDAELEKFTAECRSGDYDHLLRTCMSWFDVI